MCLNRPIEFHQTGVNRDSQTRTKAAPAGSATVDAPALVWLGRLNGSQGACEAEFGVRHVRSHGAEAGGVSF
jgi:hypothetical protein